jgi:hypothetical protein
VSATQDIQKKLVEELGKLGWRVFWAGRSTGLVKPGNNGLRLFIHRDTGVEVVYETNAELHGRRAEAVCEVEAVGGKQYRSVTVVVRETVPAEMRELDAAGVEGLAHEAEKTTRELLRRVLGE